MVVVSLIISLVITFVITWLFAKLHIFDLIGLLGCGSFILFRLLEVAAIFFVTFWLICGAVEKKVDAAGAKANDVIRDIKIEQDIKQSQKRKAAEQKRQAAEKEKLKRDFNDLYIVARTPLARYDKILKAPYGKENGMIQEDTVIKVIDKKTTDALTWLESYVLEENTAKHVFVLIPAVVDDLREDCQYFLASRGGAEFLEYRIRIDLENEATRQNIRSDFLSELEKAGVTVENSRDVVLRESIKNTHFFIPEEGYFGCFVSSGDFYYVDKKQEKALKKIVKKTQTRLEKEIKPYYEK